MKTVIYIGGFELPDLNAAAQRVISNAKALNAIGYRVILVGISRVKPYQKKLEKSAFTNESIESFEVGYPLSKRNWFDYSRSDWPVRAIIEQGIAKAGEIEAIICYNYPAIAQLRIASLARRWGSSAISDCTEWYGNRSWTTVANVMKNIDIFLRMRVINRMMDGIITTSPYMTDHYRSSGLPMIEIPSLIDGPPQTNISLQLKDGKLPLIAIASGFATAASKAAIHDRIDWIIDVLGFVAEKGGDFLLRIIGVDQDEYLKIFPEHRELLHRLDDKIVFLGRLPRSDVLSLLRGSAFSFVFRHSTRVTLAGFPTKYSESLAFGTPCIINSFPSINAYHEEGKNGFLLDLNNRESAAEHLCKIFSINIDSLIEMKKYCATCDYFRPRAFEIKIRRFLSDAIQRREAI